MTVVYYFHDIFAHQSWLTEIDVAAQPLPTGDPRGPDFTDNSNVCPLYYILEELTVNFAYVPKSGHWPTGLPTGLYTLANKISTEKTILTNMLLTILAGQ
jgi:hypothetical protein